VNIKLLVIILVIVLLLGIFLFKIFHKKELTYPILFNDSDGALYLLSEDGINKDDAIKLADYESTERVKYANSSDRYILYQSSNSLYLYDLKKNKKINISDDINAGSFYFTSDDKYIVYLDNNYNMNISNYRKVISQEENVLKINEVKDNYILFTKEDGLYIKDINKSKSTKIVDSTSDIIFSNDYSNIIFLDSNNDLYIYNLKNNKSTKIATNVNEYYCKDDSCNKLYFIIKNDSKKLYYYDGENSNKIVDDIYSLVSYIDDEIVYTKYKNDKYNLYYKRIGKDEVLVEKNTGNVKVSKIYNNYIYYITGTNKLKCNKISNNKESIELIDKVYTDLIDYKDGFIVVANVNDKYNGDLYIIKSDKVTKIDSDVNTSKIKVSSNGESIYYLKDYVLTGELNYYDGQVSKIDSDVYTYEYVKDDLVYYIKDYDTKLTYGNLYRYTNEGIKIIDKVSRISTFKSTYEN